MTEPRPRDLDGLKRKFRDFDTQEVYDDVRRAALDPKAQNFVILFGSDHAKVAVDLGIDDFKDLLHWKDKDCPVRWINFWNTTKQAKAINSIGDKFGFSPRLRASIIAWDKYRETIRAADAKKKELKEQLEAERHGTLVEKTDLETGLNDKPTKQAQSQTQPLGPASGANDEVIANFKVIQESLNYTTTDYGAHCKSERFQQPRMTY
jgi:hypothetical protein